MEYSKECPFCKDSRFNNNRLINLPTEKSILFENKNIYVQVDISPLCRGHILIITNKHYLNFFETTNEIKKEVKALKETIRKIYKDIYNMDTIFFEHGSAKPGYAGASIDHAHLHCIPGNIDIYSDLNNILKNPINCDILSQEYQFKNEFSYIYLEDSKNGKIIYKVEKLPKQFLRKLISKKFENSNYLWQEKCLTPTNQEIFNQTISDLQDKIII